MSALTEPAPYRAWRETVGALDRSFIVTTDDPIITVYAGAAVGLDTDGTVRPVATDDYPFVGFAMETAISGEAVIVRTGAGQVQVQIPLAGVDDSDLGATVYATTDNDFTLTSTGNTPVGRLYENGRGQSGYSYIAPVPA